MTSRLRERYAAEVVPALQKQFEYHNPNQVPRLSKIVVNIGLGEALTNAKALDAALGDLSTITGQRPIVTKAKRSIAQFRLRTGNSIGAKVTLRGERMWDFLDRLTTLALPRIRDFRGVPGKSFDGRGNYSLGMREQLAFPEIDYDKVDRLRGLEISIVTTAKTDEESKKLLELLGMPFAHGVRDVRLHLIRSDGPGLRGASARSLTHTPSAPRARHRLGRRSPTRRSAAPFGIGSGEEKHG